jgi:hypothetical protein
MAKSFRARHLLMFGRSGRWTFSMHGKGVVDIESSLQSISES